MNRRSAELYYYSIEGKGKEKLKGLLETRAPWELCV